MTRQQTKEGTVQNDDDNTYRLYRFQPAPDISAADIAALWEASELAIGSLVFDRLPDSVKRHFVREGGDE